MRQLLTSMSIFASAVLVAIGGGCGCPPSDALESAHALEQPGWSSSDATSVSAVQRTVEQPVMMDNAASAPAETHYDLFHPQPQSDLQPMVTDRPGQTNGPYTVAPGHLQIETGLIDYTYGHAARLSRIDVLGGTEFRIGLVPDGEFGLVLNPFSWQRQAGSVTTGFGDTSIQGKWTLWSNPSNNAGFGLIPSVTFNTAQQHLGSAGVQGGMAFPLQLPLPGDVSLGFMPAIYAVRAPAGGGYDPQVAASVSLSRTLVGNLSGFGEFAANLDAKDAGHWVGMVDFGLIYLITNDLQLDVGMNVGVTRAAPDIAPFLGLSVRF